MMAAELNRDDALQRQAYRRLNREDPCSCRREDEDVGRGVEERRATCKIGDERLTGVGMANLCLGASHNYINVLGDKVPQKYKYM